MRHAPPLSPPSSGAARRYAGHILALTGLFACSAACAQQAPAQTTPPSDPENQTKSRVAAQKDDAGKVPLEEIRRYVSVFNAVKYAYVEPVEDRKLMQSAIRGLLLDLDPHSAYLVRSDAQAFDEDSNGAYDGIGVEVLQQPDGTILVIAPIDDTPAARAGVKPGDLIIAIDGKTLTPEQIDNNPLRGEPGSKTVLTMQREGAKKPLDITVQRETIRISSVRGRMLEPGYAYVRISAFQADTATDFEQQIDKLQAQAGATKGLRGLVLDLRSNPGGLLTSAVQIADALLDKGGIVSTRGRNPVADATFNATPGDRMRSAPVVVLVDAGSASASEVLAAALRDNQRAQIVGSRTFGKGSVQTVLPLDNGDAVKITTARYYTPSGKSIQARGIDPDVVLKPDGAIKPTSGGIVSEAALPGHLRGEQEAAGVGIGDVLEGDAPIAAALIVLKKQVASLPVATDRR
jgi:carboxyl-terminal processing protease